MKGCLLLALQATSHQDCGHLAHPSSLSIPALGAWLLGFLLSHGAALTFSLCSCSLLTRASSWAFLLLRASMRASHWATRQASNSTLFSCMRKHISQPQSTWSPWAAGEDRAPLTICGVQIPAEGDEKELCPQCTFHIVSTPGYISFYSDSVHFKLKRTNIT